jgi:hypothetical protein
MDIHLEIRVTVTVPSDDLTNATNMALIEGHKARRLIETNPHIFVDAVVIDIEHHPD